MVRIHIKKKKRAARIFISTGRSEDEPSRALLKFAQFWVNSLVCSQKIVTVGVYVLGMEGEILISAEAA